MERRDAESNPMKRRVFFRIGDDPSNDRPRSPDFMSVDRMPLNTFRFRFKVKTEGHDDSTGRDFDWWFKALTEAAEEARRNGGPGPTVTVFEDVHDNGIYHQNMWTGMLAKENVDSPRRCNNPGLFQFDLKVATFTRTWTEQESVPWADGDGSTG